MQHVWRRPGEDLREECIMPTVKCGSGSFMLLGCMSANGPGELHSIDGMKDSKMYCGILKDKMVPSLRKLGRQALFQQYNDPKHTAKFTTAFLQKQKVQTMVWPSISPNLNPIEHLWGILKRQVEIHRVSNKEQLHQMVREKWQKISAPVPS